MPEILQTSNDIIEAINRLRDTDSELTAEVGETLEGILDIQFALLGQIQIVSKAIVELDSGELSDGRPCLTVGTRSRLEEFRDE